MEQYNYYRADDDCMIPTRLVGTYGKVINGSWREYGTLPFLLDRLDKIMFKKGTFEVHDVNVKYAYQLSDVYECKWDIGALKMNICFKKNHEQYWQDFLAANGYSVIVGVMHGRGTITIDKPLSKELHHVVHLQ